MTLDEEGLQSLLYFKERLSELEKLKEALENEGKAGDWNYGRVCYLIKEKSKQVMRYEGAYKFSKLDREEMNAIISNGRKFANWIVDLIMEEGTKTIAKYRLDDIEDREEIVQKLMNLNCEIHDKLKNIFKKYYKEQLENPMISRNGILTKKLLNLMEL